MNMVRKLLLWFAMLSKRLYKKPTFLVLMVLIPVMVIGYVWISGGESGIITVGLTAREEDPITREIFADLKNGSPLLNFQIYADPQEAERLLQSGKLDAVWIFPENMAEKVEQFSQKPISSNAFITVLEREDSVALMLAREKLSGVVYPYVAQRVYLHFLRDLAPELSSLSDAQLLEYYLATDLSVNLFEFGGSSARQRETNYLLSPLRGLLGTLILLCSLATAMYYIRDEENGTFAWVNQRWKFLPELGCQMTSSLHIAAVCLICLAVSGLTGNLWTELLVLVMYCLCCSIFAMALRQLCGSLRVLGVMLPLMIVVVLVICPVFFDLGVLRQAQYLLPPTYYINAVYDMRSLQYMAGYIGAMAGVTVLIQYIKRLIPVR